jgi:hypothetical protein
MQAEIGPSGMTPKPKNDAKAPDFAGIAANQLSNSGACLS